ncbi:quinone-dependent dihydroorotate dehydrogenase [Asticcacaulis sp. EMRT-3]|uniref:quinone-dependent dihydroorotate dehydrogenase n=1 Tax=Asticcacaulis sp. EMRT-3 TaxID=3040349 RepID=UPI0024AFCE0F|nr:quinone-dependent dihydroorotate dehydrogenase [Asticcacaulis sp. EMRT-3]MDI7773794.1 quinone-dependent dihydroorotate dehydrogenase [Asticcacaulis sp. EMRT-3]
MYRLATRALHSLAAEDAHSLTIGLLKAGLGPVSGLHTPQLAVDVPYAGGSLHFPNCVGLAAGFDKNADVPLAMIRAGFGFAECGTVTPLPQEGNPKPRLFRLTEDRAVINRMGFNNKGLEVFQRHLEHINAHKKGAVIGLNIGANKDAADRMNDYLTGLKRLWGMGSYFTINISSPNTPGLRALQGKSHLDDLLGQIAETRAALVRVSGQNCPIFLKIAPDLDDGEIGDTVEATLTHQLDGLIVSNTTLSREGLTSRLARESGGMSGAPLFAKSTQALRVARAASGGRLVLIGAGGVASGADAYAKIRAGASLVQLYSAIVYEGPGLADAIRRDLVARLKADGFRSVSEAVGT